VRRKGFKRPGEAGKDLFRRRLYVEIILKLFEFPKSSDEK
jgi:hypothetical protein